MSKKIYDVKKNRKTATKTTRISIKKPVVAKSTPTKTTKNTKSSKTKKTVNLVDSCIIYDCNTCRCVDITAVTLPLKVSIPSFEARLGGTACLNGSSLHYYRYCNYISVLYSKSSLFLYHTA